MSVDIVSRSLSVHQEHELLLALEKAGLSGNGAQRVIEDNGLARLLVRHAEGEIQTLFPEGHTTPEQAAGIMLANFHPLGAAVGRFGVRLSAKQERPFQTIPFRAEVLESCKNTHVLVPGLPMSMSRP